MADNVNITPGTGKTIATDEVADVTLGTVQVQFVKLMDGTLDGTSKAAVGTNGLKVDGSGATLAISGSVGLSAGATLTAYQGTSPWVTNASIVGTVPVSGTFWQTTQPVSGNVGLVAGATLTAYQGAGPWTANTSIQGIPAVSQSGTWSVTASLVAPVTVTLGGVNLNPTTGGWSAYQVSALASTVSMSATAGKFGGYMVMNLNSTPAYLQVFDLVTNVTLGLTTPTAILPLPANSTAANGLAANLELANGMNLVNGLKIGATQGATNASVVATGIVGTFWYK